MLSVSPSTSTALIRAPISTGESNGLKIVLLLTTADAEIDPIYSSGAAPLAGWIEKRRRLGAPKGRAVDDNQCRLDFAIFREGCHFIFDYETAGARRIDRSQPDAFSSCPI